MARAGAHNSDPAGFVNTNRDVAITNVNALSRLRESTSGSKIAHGVILIYGAFLVGQDIHNAPVGLIIGEASKLSINPARSSSHVSARLIDCLQGWEGLGWRFLSNQQTI